MQFNRKQQKTFWSLKALAYIRKDWTKCLLFWWLQMENLITQSTIDKIFSLQMESNFHYYSIALMPFLLIIYWNPEKPFDLFRLLFYSSNSLQYISNGFDFSQEISQTNRLTSQFIQQSLILHFFSYSVPCFAIKWVKDWFKTTDEEKALQYCQI